MADREMHSRQPDVTVATVVVRDGRVLCVEERAGGNIVINQPAGHLEPEESLADAAVRETREETGWDVRLTAFIGAYQWKAPARSDGSEGRRYLRFAFAGEPIAHNSGRELDEGILRAIWMTPDELLDARSRHRSPLVWLAVADYLGGQRFPLSMLRRLA
jgi:8-oxo-dGTP pyrophosphatase MutT (NUDIX family)